jgi:hypothetical protein
MHLKHFAYARDIPRNLFTHRADVRQFVAMETRMSHRTSLRRDLRSLISGYKGLEDHAAREIKFNLSLRTASEIART